MPVIKNMESIGGLWVIMFYVSCMFFVTKIRIYKTIIYPILTYGSETWILNKKEEKQLIVFENKILRKIFGPINEDNVWRKRHNYEIRELYKEPDIIAELKSRRLRWLGHILRKKGRLNSKFME